MISPASMTPCFETARLVHFPKRLELLFRSVFALPKASVTGFDLRIMRSTSSSTPLPAASADAAARCCSINFMASVLPAPDSPEMQMAWDRPSRTRPACAAAAIAYLRGVDARGGLPL